MYLDVKSEAAAMIRRHGAQAGMAAEQRLQALLAAGDVSGALRADQVRRAVMTLSQGETRAA